MRISYQRQGVFVLLFAISGFTGLIYESIWTHYLKLFLGHTAYAQSLVLAIFMAGMALGSWICSRYSRRWNHLITGYAFAEGAIGFLALIFPTLFVHALQWSYDSIIPQLGSPQSVILFKWILSGLLILPQTVLLGMTFPLMTAGIIRQFPHNQGASISLLYFANSFGAAIGVLASGFLLIRLLGLHGTVRLAGLINIGVSICVWLLANKLIAPTASRPVQPAAAPRQEAWYRVLLIASFITGASSFLYEIGWIRMLSLVLGSSTHAFELMLSAFILGLAFGGLWIRSRINRIADQIRFLAAVQVVMGLLALSTLLLYGQTFGVMQWMMGALSRTDTGYVLFNVLSSGIAIAIMLPATFCAGMTLPLITYALISRGHGEASIGAVYASNTVGAIVGVFFAIHLGMPLLGLKGLMTTAGGLDILLGLALLWMATEKDKSYRAPMAATIGCAALVLLTALFVKLDPYKMASGVFRHGRLQTSEDAQLLFHKDGKTATVSLFLQDGALDIRTNGKSDAVIQTDPGRPRSGDEATMILLAAAPLSLNPNAKTAANIGFGSGLTTATLLMSGRLERVDTVEIEPAMVEAAKKFGPLVEQAYTDPRSRIHIDDAKTFFSAHQNKYDIIISEPSNPWVSGTAGLFSEEFYRTARRHLTDTGVFCQWLQLYELDVDLAMSVLKALSSSFSDYAVYAANDWDILIIAGNKGGISDPDPWIFRDRKMAAALKRIQINSIDDLRLRKIGDKDFLHGLLATYPIRGNSDYDPILDQNAVRSRFLQTDAKELVYFAYTPLPVFEMLSRHPAPVRNATISAAPDFMKTQAISAAAVLRDYCLTSRFNDTQSIIPEGIREQADLLRRLFSRDCGSGSDERIANMYNTIALLMNPFLQPKELDAVWRALESNSCVRALPARDRQWIALFKVIGQRDADGMARSASALLESERGLPREPMSYLLAAGMLGNLAGGRSAEARLLWQRYNPVMFSEEDPGLLFRFLAAAGVEEKPTTFRRQNISP